MKQNPYTLTNIVRALRLPFTLASALPFIAGSILAGKAFGFRHFLLGLIAVVTTHLSANLMNDYADSKSGADWQDRRFFGFFGGSKLIQEKVFSEKFYLNAAFFCFFAGFFCIAVLAFLLKSALIIAWYLSILVCAWMYSGKPMQFSYRRVGEPVIFLLFGPVPVMGGYFIQTTIFPTLEGLCVSLPFGFLTTAILFANEVPDFSVDQAAGKLTWVSIVGPARAYRVYALLITCAFLAILLDYFLGYVQALALVSLVAIFPLTRAARILREHYSDKIRLLESSRLTILSQALVGIIVILGVIRWTK